MLLFPLVVLLVATVSIGASVSIFQTCRVATHLQAVTSPHVLILYKDTDCTGFEGVIATLVTNLHQSRLHQLQC